MNTFGNIFRLTTFGESHGSVIGGIIDGCPSGLKVDLVFIQDQLNRRRPGQSNISTPRNENDELQILSGVYQGISTGGPIGFQIKNDNQLSKDYHTIEEIYRPSHADYTYSQKYGIRDHRGGGRSSARETANWVVAGALAKLILKEKGIYINSFVKQIGSVSLDKNYDELDLTKVDQYITRCPDNIYHLQMMQLIEEAIKEGDTLGGMIQCVATDVPVGIGEPVFGKLQSALAGAMMSINAAKGFEIGSGFSSVVMKGSEHNDSFDNIDGIIKTNTNHSGGIQGGISNGMPIWFNVAFKPVSSIKKEQQTVDINGNKTKLTIEGRHDPCVVPRAVPIVEALTAMVLVDYIMLHQSKRI